MCFQKKKLTINRTIYRVLQKVKQIVKYHFVKVLFPSCVCSAHGFIRLFICLLNGSIPLKKI